MGFFKDFKEELLDPVDAISDETADMMLEESDENSLIESMVEESKGVDMMDMMDIMDEMDELEDNDIDDDFLSSLLDEEEDEEEEVTEPVRERIADELVENEVVVSSTLVKETVTSESKAMKTELTEEDKRAVTVITKGTTINGSIVSDCSLDVMGVINGDVECVGKLVISGKVVGNCVASEVYVNTERLEGNITSEGNVKIGLGTIVVGDISASAAAIIGAVKGEIDINGPIVIDSTAIIKGNVKAKSLEMKNGAVLEGFCSLSYAAVDIDTIFE